MDPRVSSRGAPARPSLAVTLLVAGGLLCWLAACVPDLPGGGPGHGPAEDGAGPALELSPEAPLDAAHPVLRFHLHLHGVAAGDVDLGRVAVVRGKVGPAHLRQIARGEISNALSERFVPSIAWIEDGSSGEPVVIAAPTVSLEPGEAYALALGAPPLAEHIRVAAGGEAPVLPRIWPPIEGGASISMGVWCSGSALPEVVADVELSPEGPRGALRRGAVGETGARCVRFEADPGEPASAEGPLVGPPALGDGEPIAGLDPRPFVVAAGPPAAPGIACEAGELPFGPGCAVVEDDRIRVRSGGAPLLWAVRGEGLDEVVAAAPGDPFVLAPLPPLRSILLDVSTVDVAGRVARGGFSAVTLAPRPHVVISEVLANPLGAEPDAEWVELYNDGSAAADLGGYVLKDIGGETALPPAPLAPGGYALIVNETFVEDDELDPVPDPAALILRVSKLGKGGLSNSGEPLKLEDATGAVVSRAPASPKPKAGMSLSRVGPRAPDGLASSFVVAWPTPGRENILEAKTP